MRPLRFVRCVLVVALAVWGFGLSGTACAQPEIPTRAPEDAPASLKLTGPDEPGQPLVVEGVVTEDGEPVAGAGVFVYQTGADGIYGPEGNSNPRIHGYLRTDEKGRFTLHTIKPGSYPGSNVAPHIHLHATPPGSDHEVTKELVFEGDPQVTERMRRSSFFYVGQVEERRNGGLRVGWEVELD